MISTENWENLKLLLKQQFEGITDHDFLSVKGKEEVLIGRIQIKSGKSKDEIIKIINNLQLKINL
jgi:uncharacterized protein YjbJ (UPF0337 family)